MIKVTNNLFVYIVFARIRIFNKFKFVFLELKYCENNNVTCQNGATCVSLPEEDGNYRCLCADGYIGRNCEVDKKKVIIYVYTMYAYYSETKLNICFL